MDDARKGDAALSASKPEEAIQHYTKALTVNPSAVKYYIGRSTAYQRTSKYAESLNDADVAVVLAKKRGTRELIKDGQFRRAVALYHLGKYADADFLLRLVKRLDEKDKMLPIWESKVATKLENLADDDEQRAVTIKETPEVEIPSTTTATAPAAPAKTDDPATPAPKPPAQTPKEKIKTDWYQTNDSVTLNIMAKGVPKDKLTVDIEAESVSLSFPIVDSSEYSYNADPLFAPIDPSRSSYQIKSTKVELLLKKATPGVKWRSLEREDGHVVATSTSQAPSTVSTKETAPAYPTSSKSGAKNWDKVVVNDLDDKDDIEGDETSHFFKKLYSGATPEQQRAMMKSYSESGGTVLSTDWSNVGGRQVVPEPPEGMEPKKY
ncbi:SGS-domain-containing protein [Stemphylium lycopersici]|uniref:SGS-domain-containing protein n=1 Tax=Stemphylium lycopersici TaxID=183478 RepID=A0A364NFK8_STELY|nr:sgt1 and cs domain-containing protein [Stemphylium lycopersici]RAR04059.1 SGS-domain-containing protein [Stemphylium lycopersici]RAR16088.1 SGS-domain-containing protein [Stemphylium lycopersici]